MSAEESRKFYVEVKELSDSPTAGPDGILRQKVRFQIAPSDKKNPFEVDGGFVQGDTLSRCIQLREKGTVTVQMPEGWVAARDADWKQAVVNAALDRAVSEGA